MRDSPPTREEAEPFPERLGDFHLLERLGGGGMGVVYLARQESLGRFVALKLIHPEQLYFPGTRERFLREVEAIARLQHPGIVPIHTFGEHDGIPYFAMERVEGGTLAEVLRTFAGRPPDRLTGADFAGAVAQCTRAIDGSAPPPSPLEVARFSGSFVEVALRIVGQVAAALAHAHERGVLHRDVKPSNVMVTPGGSVLLLDFGLATTEGVSKLTRTGALVGSLQYLAPEHLAGEAAPAPTSDVYSLGVTLYEMLALALPYRAETIDELRSEVLAGRPPSLHAANPAVPWDVETVCLTAMERDPARRYATPLAFAHDLENLLRLRPIAAQRPGVALRARRWMQRHPTWSVGLALGGLLVVGGPAAWFRVQQQNLASLRLEQQKTQREKERALANFHRVLATIQRTLERVEDPRLDEVGELEPLRRAIYADALAVYEGFRGDEANDAELRGGIGRNRRRLGELLAALGRSAEAETAYREAIDELERLRRDHPDDDDAAYQQGIALVRLAYLDVEAGRADEASAHATAAVAAFDRLRERAPDDADVLRQAIDAREILALARQRGGDVAGALQAVSEVAPLVERNVARAPQDDELRLEAANILAKAGALLSALGHAAEADPLLVRAEELLAQPTTAPSLATENDETRAELALGRADVAEQLGRKQEEVTFKLRAVELFRALFGRHPERMAYRSALATALSNLGQHRLEGGDLTEAQLLLKEAAQLLEEAARIEPDVAEHDARLCATLTNLAVAELDEKRPAPAQAHLLTAVDHGRKFRARNGDDPRGVLYLDSGLSYLAEAELDLGRTSEAAATARELRELAPDDAAVQQRAARILERCEVGAGDDPGKR